MILDMLISAVTAILPKSMDQVIEEQNRVTYGRVHGKSIEYVKGQYPASIFDPEEKKEKPPRLTCAIETDPAVIARHSTECRDQQGSHGGLCEMCKLLNNHTRFDLLVRLYSDDRSLDQAGFNVSGAADKSNGKLSATSAHLLALARIGLVRREHAGRLVNYSADYSKAAPAVAEIAALMRERLRRDRTDTSFAAIFRPMMGSQRSRIVRHIAAGGCGNVQYLREKFNIVRLNDLERDLKPALEAHILDLDSNDPSGNYTYVTPADPIARRIVELS